MNSSDLFYIRKLQLIFFYKNNDIIYKLFFFEQHLFNLPINIDEILVINIKLKWLEDEIKKFNKLNPIVNNLSTLIESNEKKNLINLVLNFSEILNEDNEIKLIKKVQKFSKIFNNIIRKNSKGSKFFETSFFSQLIFFLYNSRLIKKFDFEYFKSLYRLMDKSKFDIFEVVFLDIFFKRNDYKELKIKKVEYLLRLFFRFLND